MSREPRSRSGFAALIRGRTLSAGLGLLLLAGPLGAGTEILSRTIRVPQDHPLISQAVVAAAPGDVVEVDDGYYFERGVILDKALTLRSRRLFGAVIYGSADPGSSIFIVRAPVDISGFILRDADCGIMQRDSPDVEWTGRDLAFIGLRQAVRLDDRFVRIGSVRLQRLIIDACEGGVLTNEARRVQVDSCLAVRTGYAFQGSNHESYRVDRAVLWNCFGVTRRDEYFVDSTGGTNRIDLGPEVRAFFSSDPEPRRREFLRRLKGLFRPAAGEPSESRDLIRRRDAVILAVTGRALLDGGDAVAAKAAFREALVRAEETGIQEARWQAFLGLARTAEKLGDGQAAAGRFRLAIEAVEDVASRFPRGGFLSAFLRDKIGLYEALIRHLLRDGLGPEPSREDREAAFLWADRSKARSARIGLRLPASGPAETAEGLSLSLRDSERGVSRAQASLLDPAATPAAVAARLRRLDAAERRRLSLMLRSREQASLGGPGAAPQLPPTSLPELRTLLREESAALLEYVVTPEESWAFLLTRDGLAVAALPAEGEMRRLAANYLRFLTSRDSRRFLGRAGGGELRRILLGPFEGRLRNGITRLIVVPDGPLHYLPFEALPASAGAGRFLVEEFEISYAASAAFLLDLRRRPGPAGLKMDFLGLAASEAFRIWTPAEGGPLRFPSLPYAATEVRSVGRMFPRSGRTILAGREASERRLKALPLGDYRIIHIAAHGFFQDGRWWRSAMRLRGEPDASEDGLLQPADIESLGLNGDLVVLSGCRTGGLELSKGEGLLGMTASFFTAGARSLLLSLWSVNDRPTARFMKSFYRAWQGGRTKSQALRLAKIEALSRGEPPFVWAAFVLMGD